jgi:hypothetical protein
MSDKITRLGEDENDSTALQLYGFTALRLYGFTALRLYGFTALRQNDQFWQPRCQERVP